MKNNKKPDKDWVRDQIPDYIFNKMDSDEKLIFESYLKENPEIQKEIDEIAGVFSKFDISAYQSDLDHRTRNLSVSVNSRLQGRRSDFLAGTIYMKLLKYFAPVLAIGMIFIILYNNKPLDPNQLNGKQAGSLTSDNNQFLTNSDYSKLNKLIDTVDFSGVDLVDASSDLIDRKNIFDPVNNLTDETNEFVEDYFDESVFTGLFINENVNKTIPGNTYDLLDNLSGLDNTEIQQLIKELGNVNI